PRQRHPTRAPVARKPERRGIARWLVVVAWIHGRSRSRNETVVPTVVVEPRRSRTRGVDQLVVASAPDHPDQGPRSIRPPHDGAVVPTVQEESDFLRLASVECPAVVRLPTGPGRES